MTAGALVGLQCKDTIVKIIYGIIGWQCMKGNNISRTITVITPPTITNQGTSGLVSKPYYKTGPFTVPV